LAENKTFEVICSLHDAEEGLGLSCGGIGVRLWLGLLTCG